MHIMIASVLLISTKAIAEEKWYATTFGGINYVNQPYKGLKLAPGYITGVTVGRQLGPYLRCEGELSYRENQNEHTLNDVTFMKLKTPSINWFAKQQQTQAMLNGIVDFAPKSFLSPYVGGGIGRAHTMKGMRMSFSEIKRSGKNSEQFFDNSAQEIIGLRLNHPRGTAEIAAEYRHTHLLRLNNSSDSLIAKLKIKF